MLQRVQGGVPHRALVERGHVPEDEDRRPERERERRVREDAQPLDRAQREQRPQQRPGQPCEQAERREVADDDVLEHVEEEELLLGEGGDRRGERQDEQNEAEGEHRDPRAGHGRPAPPQRQGPHPVGDRDEGHRGELERLEGPAREE